MQKNLIGIMRNVRAAAVWIITCLVLAACTMPSTRFNEMRNNGLDDVQEAIAESSLGVELGREPVETPPEDVLRALVPGLSLESQGSAEVEERFDFAVQSAMQAREFFTLITQGTDYSIAVHPNVTGTISALDLKDVTISEALDQVSVLYGFEINRIGDIFQVLPGGLQTRIFHVDYLNVIRNGTSNMRITASGIVDGDQNNGNLRNGNRGFGNNLGYNQPALSNNFGNTINGSQFGSQYLGQNSGGATINTQTEANFWQDLEDVLMSIIEFGTNMKDPQGGDQKRSVIISGHTGMVVVRAYPDELARVSEFLEKSQNALQRQVVLEAKILEVDLKEEFQTGIDLNVLSEVNNGNLLGASYNFTGDELGAVSSPLAVAYNATDFTGVIRMLETQGNVQVMSSPRISTLNNQKAVFKVGNESYYFTSANTVTFGGGDLATTTQNLDLQPFFSGIALDVTPQISEEGDIILHIHPILSEVKEEIKFINDSEYPLAFSTTRESDSIARARNGEVIVISGLMQTRARGEEGGIVGASNVPLIGGALRQRQQEVIKTELVILLRAVVDEPENMQELIQEHAENFTELRGQIDPYFRNE